ncbi:TIGR00341 family protein [Psychrobacter frigidicola]|uniref:TIGR00341 family protein n=1 Tax=Psychrobacter frigidicola TaxID=45611 RepID=A0A5C7A659_9GAMM|nr:TIGR00341 family protein [Psychrobacter frigidicola]TXD98185.1 TIGR00341 family protein [Psychrobacter frigidicola]
MTASAKPPFNSNKNLDPQYSSMTPDDESKISDADKKAVNKTVTDEVDADKIDSNSVDNEKFEVYNDAQYPESKVTMSSPSPDVVIATLETPDPETQISIGVVEPKFQGNDNTQIMDAETDSSTEVTSRVSSNSDNAVDSDKAQDRNHTNDSEITLEEETTKEEALDAIPHTDSDDDNQDDNKIDTNEESELTEEEKELEEVKEEKESKLESYKQFVAEQFNSQKIDYPEVRVTIEANAIPSKMYFIMNVLSAIIASYGLIADSAAVVIGAMLVAMMLGPITGVALAVIDYRMPLLRKSLFTVAAGVSLVILVGFIVGWLHKGQPLTAEVLSRTQPTSMDLMIALAGGTAGAYAMVSPHLSVAVVGVAVATALVPPLAASGILLANGEMQLGLGAALLAITNIIAIQFTNAMVLWFLGFRRLVDDDYKSSTYLTFFRRNAVTLLLLVGLGIYLTINLNTNARQQTFENNVKETINDYFKSKGNVLTNTQFDRSDGNEIVRAVIRGETTPSSYDVRQIEATITQNMKDNFPSYLPIKIQLRYLPVQVIESNPLIQDKLDKTDAAILTN